MTTQTIDHTTAQAIIKFFEYLRTSEIWEQLWKDEFDAEAAGLGSCEPPITQTMVRLADWLNSVLPEFDDANCTRSGWYRPDDEAAA
jgi:hypothetical protein